jgi:uncharacterized protein
LQREVMWSSWDGTGMEHLRLQLDDDGIAADGVIIGVAEERPFRVRYEIRCDPGWDVRSVCVAEVSSISPTIDLFADGEGNWATRDGVTVPDLGGCVDVDLSMTPFTNTLPIRRLELAPDESAELSVAYIQVGKAQVRAEQQRYTRLESYSGGELYRYESLDSGFTADLPVDEDGLVVDYPGLSRRAFSISE